MAVEMARRAVTELKRLLWYAMVAMVYAIANTKIASISLFQHKMQTLRWIMLRYETSCNAMSCNIK